MDIKTLILIGGGVMITAVILHGVWIAWRSRREPLKLAIQPDLIPDDFDESSRFKGELPNGGARVRREPEQEALELDEPAPLLLNPTGQVARSEETGARSEEINRELFGGISATEPAHPNGAGHAETEADSRTTTRRPAVRQRAATIERAAQRARVTEVRLEPAVAAQKTTRRGAVDSDASQQSADNGAPEELLVMHVLAQNGQTFAGSDILTSLRSKGLRYGQMNIFHRLDPMSKVIQYSVANAVKPGTLDLSELDNLSTPGLTFFMRLPGPQQPQEAFDDMWRAAQDVAISLGGVLGDDQRCAITAQTIEHYRGRILDFSRRTLSRRA